MFGVLRQKTILRQLLTNLLLPVVGVLFVVFLVLFSYNQQKLQEQLQKEERNILAETKNLTFYFDFSIRQHERVFIQPLREHAEQLRDIFQTQSPKTANLFQLSRQLGIDTTNEHLYIIDENQTIVNTTFEPDLGLNFAQLNASYIDFFNGIRKQNVFKEDRFGLEMKTGKIKKYAFLPTADKRYVIEIGKYSNEANAYRELLLKRIASLGNRYASFKKVDLFLGVKGSPDVRSKNKRFNAAYLKCLDTGKPQTVAIDRPETKYKERWDLFFIPVRDSKLYAGYILALEVDDSEEQRLFADLFQRFVLIFAVSIGFLILLMIWRARKIANPIRSLSEQTLAISSENLGAVVTAGGSAELEQLSANFNQMIGQLKDSYDTLEDKVVERTRELSEQKIIVEEKNKEIVESIEYARFIQQALLPDLNHPKQFIHELEVLYLPKDIIAGDFYWLQQQKDEWWIAVADCTGHGVPGAMVSVLCMNALQQTFTEKYWQETGTFLDAVREKVIASFSKEQRQLKDGMDISLLRYFPNEKRLQWSGANNPLWIIRDMECLEWKGDKQPIGAYAEQTPFSTHDITLLPKDLVCLFSDGYADQFGGPKNKKFKYSSLKETLQQCMQLVPSERSVVLEQTFSNWKGKEEQTDDVCVLTFRIN